MSYQSSTIAAVLNRLNRSYFLPAIQREFVWSPDQVIKFFDSLMRRYPIGSFLFWDLSPESHEKWQVYRFLESVYQGGTHNELAVTNGVQQLTLVLDGQQRLTSLLIGLRGAYTVKKKYKRYGNPEAWIRQSLFLDLLQDPKLDDDTDLDLRYGFRFMDKAPDVDASHHWFRVGRILVCDGEDKYERFRAEEVNKLPKEKIASEQKRIVENNLDR